MCWPNDQYKAKGLVADIRNNINVKDSFTRMKNEREKERQKHIDSIKKKNEELQLKRKAINTIKNDLYTLLKENEPKSRGKKFEEIANSLFKESGILLRDSFTITGERGEGIIEQIDGVVEIKGNIYLVEFKWLNRNVDINDVSRHLVRIYHRNSTRGILISFSEYTKPAISTCKEALQKTVIVLCTLEEIIRQLELEKDILEILDKKIKIAITDKIHSKKYYKILAIKMCRRGADPDGSLTPPPEPPCFFAVLTAYYAKF
ncbi:MAG: restriction endonuclease [Candidatus Zixiibacteriota bacterium]